MLSIFHLFSRAGRARSEKHKLKCVERSLSLQLHLPEPAASIALNQTPPIVPYSVTSQVTCCCCRSHKCFVKPLLQATDLKLHTPSSCSALWHQQSDTRLEIKSGTAGFTMSVLASVIRVMDDECVSHPAAPGGRSSSGSSEARRSSHVPPRTQ